MSNDLISRKWLTDAIRNRRTYLSYEDAKDVIDLIDNAPTVEERMSYVQQAVNTIMHDSTGDSDVDKAFRNAARLIQNAIDGETPEFEHIEREPEKAKESEIIKAYTKGFDTGVETVKDERSQSEILYPGKVVVDELGISVIVSVDENGIATAKTLLPKSAFVEAYNKYIKEGAE